MYKTQGLKNSRIEVADKHERGPLEGLWRHLTWIGSK